jgi:uncharacterized membrane protein
MTKGGNGSKKERLACSLTGRELPRQDLVNLETVRDSLVERIRRDHPDLARDALVSRKELARYRGLYVEELLKAERGDLTEIERRVTESLAKNDTLAEDVERTYEEKRTFPEWLADQLASLAGSWSFIVGFCLALAIWITFNQWRGSGEAFDPYPFILLNLILSCVAALQAPVIMMSQKRQEAKDRMRSLNDYQVNLKAELEIRNLHEKIDHLLSKQWQRLAEIQQVQLEMLADRQR